MAKAKKAIFEDEEALQSIEELKNVTYEPTPDEIEKLFNYTPMQVDEAIVAETIVEVTPIRDFRCFYGGVQYFFSKNKKQRVPIEVRDFLLMNKQNPKIKDI
jgi:hypothetical protein